MGIDWHEKDELCGIKEADWRKESQQLVAYADLSSVYLKE